jgi:hypothetical protein
MAEVPAQVWSPARQRSLLPAPSDQAIMRFGGDRSGDSIAQRPSIGRHGRNHYDGRCVSRSADEIGRRLRQSYDPEAIPRRF